MAKFYIFFSEFFGYKRVISKIILKIFGKTSCNLKILNGHKGVKKYFSKYLT